MFWSYSHPALFLLSFLCSPNFVLFFNPWGSICAAKMCILGYVVFQWSIIGLLSEKTVILSPSIHQLPIAVQLEGDCVPLYTVLVHLSQPLGLLMYIFPALPNRVFPCGNPQPLSLTLVLPDHLQWSLDLGRGVAVYVFPLRMSILQSLSMCTLASCGSLCYSPFTGSRNFLDEGWEMHGYKFKSFKWDF